MAAKVKQINKSYLSRLSKVDERKALGYRVVDKNKLDKMVLMAKKVKVEKEIIPEPEVVSKDKKEDMEE